MTAVSTFLSPQFLEDLFTGYFNGKAFQFLLCFQDRSFHLVTSQDQLTATFTATGHGCNDDDQVVLTSQGNAAAQPPIGFRFGKPYYIVNATTDTFQLAHNEGGSPIQIQGEPSGSYYVEKLPWGRYATVADVETTELAISADYQRGELDLTGSGSWKEAERRFLFERPSPFIYTPTENPLTFDSFAVVNTTDNIVLTATILDQARTIPVSEPFSFPFRLAFGGFEYTTEVW
jgi:hypothetical protein